MMATRRDRVQKETVMPHYLVQVAYTPQAWAAQLKDPQDRTKIVGAALERVGARFVNAYLAFGEYDVVFIMEAPDNLSAAGVSMAVSAGGAVKAIKTTPLMTIEEGIQAMRKGVQAAGVYRPPGG